jgi:hypothetical protein
MKNIFHNTAKAEIRFYWTVLGIESVARGGLMQIEIRLARVYINTKLSPHFFAIIATYYHV